jgi:hypothetical protein
MTAPGPRDEPGASPRRDQPTGSFTTHVPETFTKQVPSPLPFTQPEPEPPTGQVHTPVGHKLPFQTPFDMDVVLIPRVKHEAWASTPPREPASPRTPQKPLQQQHCGCSSPNERETSVLAAC